MITKVVSKIENESLFIEFTKCWFETSIKAFNQLF